MPASRTLASAGNFRTDHQTFINAHGLAGARIGIARQFTGVKTETDAVFEQAVQIMRDAGAIVVDPVVIPSLDEYNASLSEIIVLIFEFKRDLNAYLATCTGVPVNTLADVIEFNRANADRELKFFGQELMELAEAEIFDEATYLAALADGPRVGGDPGSRAPSHRAVGSHLSHAMQRQIAAQRLTKMKVWRPAGL